jgi:predicted ATPase
MSTKSKGVRHIKRITIHHKKFPVTDIYPFNLPVIQQTSTLPFTAPVTFFVGENGSGKSTLLTALSYACNIYIWQGDTRTRASYNPYERKLYSCVSVEWADGVVPGSYFSAELFQNFSRIVDEWASTDPGVLAYYGGQSLLTQSHGQSLMSYFRARFSIKGLYLFDEPEAALSPKTQLLLLDELHRAAGEGKAQFVIATHSPILLACPQAVIYSFDRSPIETITYRETEHFKLYKDFLKNPKPQSHP